MLNGAGDQLTFFCAARVLQSRPLTCSQALTCAAFCLHLGSVNSHVCEDCAKEKVLMTVRNATMVKGSRNLIGIWKAYRVTSCGRMAWFHAALAHSIAASSGPASIFPSQAPLGCRRMPHVTWKARCTTYRMPHACSGSLQYCHSNSSLHMCFQGISELHVHTTYLLVWVMFNVNATALHSAWLHYPLRYKRCTPATLGPHD